jgi:hypothetical protein
MQDRFKFRAWDTENREWVYVQMGHSDGIPPISKPVVFDGNWQCVIMQYTGLKDKNGKEIFEGDIIKAKSYGSEEIFCMEWIGETGCGCHNGLGYYIPSENNPPEEWEVIGNIYENPELLNKQKSE